ncbi:MAG: cation transporter [Clostridia bacterium]|nr:cation transporter [Clostridia bacterium]
MVGIAVNFLLAVFKIVAGILSGLVSVTADGVNSLSDALGNVIVLWTGRVSGKEADREHPYGHGRAEYLGTFLVGVMIMLMGLETARDALREILRGDGETFELYALIVMMVSFLGKIGLYLFQRHLGLREKLPVLLAEARDTQMDLVSTVAVMLGMLLSSTAGWHMDGWIALFVACLVIKTGWDTVKEMTDRLIGQGPDPKLTESISEILSSRAGILDFHDLYVYDLGPERRTGSVHVLMQDQMLSQAHGIIDGAEKEIMDKLGVEVSIHPDPVPSPDGLQGKIEAALLAYLRAQQLPCTVHDLYLKASGDGEAELHFDLVLDSWEREKEKEEILSGIRSYLMKACPGVRPVIRVDIRPEGTGGHLA